MPARIISGACGVAAARVIQLLSVSARIIGGACGVASARIIQLLSVAASIFALVGDGRLRRRSTKLTIDGTLLLMVADDFYLYYKWIYGLGDCVKLQGM